MTAVIPESSLTHWPSGTVRDPHQGLVRPLTLRNKYELPWLDSLGNRTWVIEIGSCLVSSIALAAVVTTLAMHQDKPLPQWPSLITINSLVAVFTAIMKAGLLMPVSEGIFPYTSKEGKLDEALM